MIATLLFRPLCCFLLALTSRADILEKNHMIRDNGLPWHIQGISWFGFETQDMVMNGLWSHPMTFYMDLLQQEGFNAMRVPFSSEWILYHFDSYPYDGLLGSDPERQHKKSIEILDDVFDMAHTRGIRILLDLHRLKWDYISELWYSTVDERFTSDTFLQAWYAVLDRYQGHPALWGVDLLNEPHGTATWGTGDHSNDWRLFAEYALAQIEARYTNATWIYMVEGVGWGKDLTGAAYAPLRPPISAVNRTVYSVHNYGKSVVSSVNPYDVNSLHQDWDAHFGFLPYVITGEYGGLDTIDEPWMENYAKYLITKNITDTFFWSLGPNSGDVAGYLHDDWTTVDTFKRELVQSLGRGVGGLRPSDV